MTEAAQKPQDKVAFIGVGRMGSPMFQCVLDAGYEAVVCDPSDKAVAPFLEAHPGRVRRAATPRQAAEAADVIDVVVNTNEQLLEACSGPDGVLAGAKKGSIVLVHSTVARPTLMRLAEEAAQRGVHLLDAMVSGALGHMSVGDLAVMVGGDKDAFERAKPVMETYGGLVMHLGPQGAGLDAKLALNMLRYMSMVASQEAALFADTAGVGAAMEKLVAHTNTTRYVGNLARLKLTPIEQRRHDVETAKKDLRAAVARGAEIGVPLTSAELAIDLMARVWATEEK